MGPIIFNYELLSQFSIRKDLIDCAFSCVVFFSNIDRVECPIEAAEIIQEAIDSLHSTADVKSIFIYFCPIIPSSKIH